jgi:hypothetical protein
MFVTVQGDPLEGGARSAGSKFLKKRMLVFFFSDFEILPTISWMEDGESVESSVDPRVVSLSPTEG